VAMTKKLYEVSHFEPCCYDNFTKDDRELILNVSKALGNAARLEIYNFLMETKGCFTGQIVEFLPLAQSTVSQHLKVLHEAGVIIGTVEGNATNYCVNHDLMQRYHMLIGKML
jgi:ArsR family transcriptional regulator